MMDLIPYFSVVYAYWTALLLIWSCVVTLSSYYIVRMVASLGRSTRSYDRQILLATSLSATILLTVALLFPPIMIEPILFVYIWYTIYLICVTHAFVTTIPRVKKLCDRTTSVDNHTV